MTNISDKEMISRINRELSKAKDQEMDSLSKLSSGSVFSGNHDRPAEHAIAEKMEHRIRSLSASKRNINDGLSFIQTVDATMGEVNNMIIRMKEINTAATSSTMSDQERRYLFIEYDALYDELNRVAHTTEFNGMPLLNGESEKVPESLTFRLDDPFLEKSGFFGQAKDINTVQLDELKKISTTTESLGLKSAKDLLSSLKPEEGIPSDDVKELMTPENSDSYSSNYEEALDRLSNHRAVLGALQARFMRSLDFVDVYQENVSAAKSKIADTDYAQEATNLIQAKVAINATTALLAQTNMDANYTYQLLSKL